MGISLDHLCQEIYNNAVILKTTLQQQAQTATKWSTCMDLSSCLTLEQHWLLCQLWGNRGESPLEMSHTFICSWALIAMLAAAQSFFFFRKERWASCATCSEKSTDVFDKCTFLTQVDLWHPRAGCVWQHKSDVPDSRSAVTCYLHPHFWCEKKPSTMVMICGQKCPSTLLAQSETNLGEYVGRNFLFCSSAPMPTNPWWWTFSIQTNDLVKLCLLPSSADCGKSFWEGTLLHLLLFHNIQNMKRFTLSHGQVSTGSVDLKSYWLLQHLLPECQWEEVVPSE